MDAREELAEGDRRASAGDGEAALRCYAAAAAAGAPPVAVAWRTGLVHHLRGHVDEALRCYLGADVPGAGGAADDLDGALLLSWRAAARWLAGDHEGCRADAGRADLLARATGDDRAHAAASTALALAAATDGDRRWNEIHHDRALRHAERAGDALQVLRVRCNRGSRLLEEGSCAEAVAELDRALAAAAPGTTGFLEALVLTNRGEATSRLGRLEEALDDLLAASDLFRRLESSLVAYALGVLGDVRRLRGEPALARLAYEEALRAAAGTSDPQASVPALTGLAHLLADEDPAAARAALDAARAAPPVVSPVRTLLAAGAVAHAGGDVGAAAGHAARARDEALARKDRPGLAEALELLAATSPSAPAAEHLERAVEVWRDVGDPLGRSRAELSLGAVVGGARGRRLVEEARGALVALGAGAQVRRADAVAAGLRRSTPAAVRVEALGAFRVLLHGVVVPRGAWQSRKARDLLKVLVVHRGRPVAREVLVDLLWPAEDPGTCAPRLSVALSTLRRVLDPDHALPADALVVADPLAVRLDLSAVEVDVEQLLAATTALERDREAAGAERSVALREAEALCRGEVLAEDRYETWADPLREVVREAVAGTLRALAASCAREDDHDGAVRRLLRLLEADPWDERAHRGLVASFSASGRHGEARRAQARYAARMAELGLPASPAPVRRPPDG